MMDSDFLDAIDRLTKEGLVIRYDQVTDQIKGGTKISRPNSVMEGLVDPFSILRTNSGWVTSKLWVFLKIHIEKPTLSEAVDVVAKLYAKVEQFDDVSMDIGTALETLAKAGLVGKFVQEKVPSITICSREVREECVEGISILRLGGYFVISQFSDRGATAVNYSETLAEAVENLILIKKSV